MFIASLMFFKSSHLLTVKAIVTAELTTGAELAQATYSSNSYHLVDKIEPSYS